MIGRYFAVAFFTVARPSSSTGQATCFRPLATPGTPPSEPPFDATSIAKMRGYFLTNFNFEKTGALIAAPGDVPALTQYHVEGGYRYEWTRDAALSISALLKMLDSPVGTVGGASAVTPKVVEALAMVYVYRVKAIMDQDGMYNVHTEPRWGIFDTKPYSENWCKPQTDGPALRVQSLLEIANRTKSVQLKQLAWELAKKDLDWLSEPGGHHIYWLSCDLWEETVWADKLLWNQVAMRAALQMGTHVAKGFGDNVRAQSYASAVANYLQNPMSQHVKKGPFGNFITECPPGSTSCSERGGDLDGAVILSFIHSHWLELGLPAGAATLPIAIEVANTVRLQNVLFCAKFAVNQADTRRGIPGILYGRYSKDSYGGGNPWILITASLASLLYQAAQTVSRGDKVAHDALAAWRAALWPAFSGSALEFVSAGDAVLARLHEHVKGDDFHLWEQLDKHTGNQYNAKDLTWSYAEVFSALRERGVAMKLARPETQWV